MGLRQALKSSELLKWKKKEFPQMSGNQIIVISRTKDVWTKLWLKTEKQIENENQIRVAIEW